MSTNRHIISISVINHPGVLMRIAGLFSRRGYSIDSLSVGVSENQELSRITVAVRGDNNTIEQIRKQVEKLYDVVSVTELEPDNSVVREIALIKLCPDQTQRTEIFGLVEVFRANIIDVSRENVTIEITGDQRKVNAFIELMESYNIIREIARTGITGLQRGAYDKQ